ncbi:MAG: radical SAM protein [Bacteroidales bacterium]|jgi:radical SAM protein with 4Fe4S-binding SPASM domain|nr:radical SAM protein [Bacteroidales bacterium]
MEKMALALSKSLNLMVSGYSFLKSMITRKAAIAGMPVTLSVELTNHCNLKCPECFCGSGKMTREKGFMDIALFGRIADELRPFLLEMSLYFQGESMLHPRFGSFLEKAGGIQTTLATNGHFLSPANAEMIALSGLNKLIVSLDGLDHDSYSQYRLNGDFRTVTEGIGNMSEAVRKHGSSCKLIIQFLVNRENEHQIPDMKRFARKMKASLKLKSMQVINTDSHEKWLPSDKKFRRYELKGNEYTILSNLPDSCKRLWFNPVISWDGKVLPCCFDKDADHILGDLNDSTFREIWTGRPYRLFRQKILNGRKMTAICCNCSSGLFPGIIS